MKALDSDKSKTAETPQRLLGENFLTSKKANVSVSVRLTTIVVIYISRVKK